MDSKKLKTFDLRFWLSLLVFALLVACICTFPIWFTSQKSMYDFNTTGQIGDTIGGTMGPFVAIAAAILTFLAFWVQYKANEQQKSDINEQKTKANIEGLETRFMEMVKMHRDNVGELTYTTNSRKRDPESGKDIIEKHTAHLRKVFKEIFKQVKDLNLELLPFFVNTTPEIIYEDTYLTSLKSRYRIQEREINWVSYAKVDILYCIVYFGLSAEDSETIEDFFRDRYKPSFFQPLLKLASIKPKVESNYWKKWENFNKQDRDKKIWFINYWAEGLGPDGKFDLGKVAEHMVKNPNAFNDLNEKSNYTKYYGGHQFRLGHYFRHLYQTVNIIDKSKILSFEEKYVNIKLLRGQLSTYEQIIFFLNSISILGRVWEFEPKVNLTDNEKHTNWLVTRYNLIKNIAKNEVIDGIFVTEFYPLVSYEANFRPDLDDQRLTLRQKYKAEKANSSDIPISR